MAIRNRDIGSESIVGPILTGAPKKHNAPAAALEPIS
jgi:hypothetical protein